MSTHLLPSTALHCTALHCGKLEHVGSLLNGCKTPFSAVAALLALCKKTCPNIFVFNDILELCLLPRIVFTIQIFATFHYINQMNLCYEKGKDFSMVNFPADKLAKIRSKLGQN
jgi:hypothetical protein